MDSATAGSEVGDGDSIANGSKGQDMTDSIVLEEEIDPNYVPSESEVIEYAKWLGMDLEGDKDLFWIAREGLMAPLPKSWKPCKTKDTEDIYYFNFSSGESSWDHPCDEYYKRLYEEEKKKKETVAKENNDEKRSKAKQDVDQLLGKSEKKKKKKSKKLEEEGSVAEPLKPPKALQTLGRKPLPVISLLPGSSRLNDDAKPALIVEESAAPSKKSKASTKLMSAMGTADAKLLPSSRAVLGSIGGSTSVTAHPEQKFEAGADKENKASTVSEPTPRRSLSPPLSTNRAADTAADSKKIVVHDSRSDPTAEKDTAMSSLLEFRNHSASTSSYSGGFDVDTVGHRSQDERGRGVASPSNEEVKSDSLDSLPPSSMREPKAVVGEEPDIIVSADGRREKSLLRRISDLEEENTGLKSDKNALKTAKSKLESKLLESQERVEAVELAANAEKSKLKAKIGAMEEYVESLEKDLDRSREAHMKLKTEIQQIERMADDEREQVEQKQRETANTMKQLKMELEELKSSNEVLEMKLAQQEKRSRQAELAVSGATESDLLRNAQQTHAATQKELQEQIARLQADLLAERKKGVALGEEKAAIEAQSARDLDEVKRQMMVQQAESSARDAAARSAGEEALRDSGRLRAESQQQMLNAKQSSSDEVSRKLKEESLEKEIISLRALLEDANALALKSKARVAELEEAARNISNDNILKDSSNTANSANAHSLAAELEAEVAALKARNSYLEEQKLSSVRQVSKQETELRLAKDELGRLAHVEEQKRKAEFDKATLTGTIEALRREVDQLSGEALVANERLAAQRSMHADEVAAVTLQLQQGASELAVEKLSGAQKDKKIRSYQEELITLQRKLSDVAKDREMKMPAEAIPAPELVSSGSQTEASDAEIGRPKESSSVTATATASQSPPVAHSLHGDKSPDPDAELLKKLRDAQSMSDRYSADNASLSAALENAVEEVKNLRLQLSNVQKEVSAAYDAMSSAEMTARTDREQTSRRVQQLERELQSATAELTHTSSLYEALFAEDKLLKEQLLASKARANELNAEKELLQMSQDALREEAGSYRARWMEAARKLSELELETRTQMPIEDDSALADRHSSSSANSDQEKSAHYAAVMQHFEKLIAEKDIKMVELRSSEALLRAEVSSLRSTVAERDTTIAAMALKLEEAEIDLEKAINSRDAALRTADARSDQNAASIKDVAVSYAPAAEEKYERRSVRDETIPRSGEYEANLFALKGQSSAFGLVELSVFVGQQQADMIHLKEQLARAQERIYALGSSAGVAQAAAASVASGAIAMNLPKERSISPLHAAGRSSVPPPPPRVDSASAAGSHEPRGNPAAVPEYSASSPVAAREKTVAASRGGDHKKRKMELKQQQHPSSSSRKARNVSSSWSFSKRDASEFYGIDRHNRISDSEVPNRGMQVSKQGRGKHEEIDPAVSEWTDIDSQSLERKIVGHAWGAGILPAVKPFPHQFERQSSGVSGELMELRAAVGETRTYLRREGKFQQCCVRSLQQMKEALARQQKVLQAEKALWRAGSQRQTDHNSASEINQRATSLNASIDRLRVFKELMLDREAMALRFDKMLSALTNEAESLASVGKSIAPSERISELALATHRLHQEMQSQIHRLLRSAEASSVPVSFALNAVSLLDTAAPGSPNGGFRSQQYATTPIALHEEDFLWRNDPAAGQVHYMPLKPDSRGNPRSIDSHLIDSRSAAPSESVERLNGSPFVARGLASTAKDSTVYPDYFRTQEQKQLVLRDQITRFAERQIESKNIYEQHAGWLEKLTQDVGKFRSAPSIGSSRQDFDAVEYTSRGTTLRQGYREVLRHHRGRKYSSTAPAFAEIGSSSDQFSSAMPAHTDYSSIFDV